MSRDKKKKTRIQHNINFRMKSTTILNLLKKKKKKKTCHSGT